MLPAAKAGTDPRYLGDCLVGPALAAELEPTDQDTLVEIGAFEQYVGPLVPFIRWRGLGYREEDGQTLMNRVGASQDRMAMSEIWFISDTLLKPTEVRLLMRYADTSKDEKSVIGAIRLLALQSESPCIMDWLLRQAERNEGNIRVEAARALVYSSDPDGTVRNAIGRLADAEKDANIRIRLALRDVVKLLDEKEEYIFPPVPVGVKKDDAP